MSFPLGSLGADGSATLTATPAGTPPRWRRQALLIAAALAWLLLLLALATHHVGDTAFSTSGTGDALRNKVGPVGARVSDMVLFLFGFSGAG